MACATQKQISRHAPSTAGVSGVGVSSVVSPPRPSPPRRGRGRVHRCPRTPDCSFVVYLADSSVIERSRVKVAANAFGGKWLRLLFKPCQGCIKLSILSPRGTSGERTEDRGNQ